MNVKCYEMLPKYLMNMHAELSELWEAWRKGNINAPCDKSAKMLELNVKELTCFEEELADIVIRALDTAHAFGIDIEKAIESKHAYNATRSHRHGGKLA